MATFSWSGREAFDFDLARIEPVGGQPLEIPDGHGFILVAAATGLFTSVGADSSQHSGQRQILHDDFKGFFVLSFLYHLHVALHIQTGRAGKPARGLVRFLNGESTGNGLGVFLVCGPPGGQTLIVLARQFHRAHLRTIPAGRALGCINVARSLSEGDLEVSLDAREVLNFSARDQVDVQMPADLDQFGRDNSHGAVIGRKGLVQLAHHAADGG